jgi:hypothetical protein
MGANVCEWSSEKPLSIFGIGQNFESAKIAKIAILLRLEIEATP